MGQQNSKYNSSYEDPEKGVIPQNTRKIHGLSRILTAKAEHRREVAIQGWDKHDQNMVIKSSCQHFQMFKSSKGREFRQWLKEVDAM